MDTNEHECEETIAETWVRKDLTGDGQKSTDSAACYSFVSLRVHSWFVVESKRPSSR